MAKIVIVGAGPTGATLALLLAQRGISVTLIEATNGFQRVFRGEGLMPSGLEALSQMGLTHFLESLPTLPLTAWEFIVEGRSLFRVEEPMGSECPCTLIAQPPLLNRLINQAQTHPTFEFIQGTAVNDILWSPWTEGEDAPAHNDKRRVSGVRLADGRTLTASLVIGADGRHSVVRQRAGLDLQTQPNPMVILWFKLPAPPRLVENNVFYSIVNQGQVFSAFHSAEPGQMHVAWVVYPQQSPDRPTHEKRSSQQWAERLASLSPDWLARHFRDCQEAITSPIRLSVMVGRCPSWHNPGVLLLGDAAHPMSPVRAQGINMALRDVIVAANHLVPMFNSKTDGSPDRQSSSEPQQFWARIDGAIATIQSEREPDIIRAQHLQQSEAQRGELIRCNPLFRLAILKMAPLVSPLLKRAWVHKQTQLRNGSTTVELKV